MRTLLLALLALPLLPAPRTAPALVPVRVDFPAGADPALAVPVTGGVPFPAGAVAEASRVRLVRGEEEVPAQADVTAVWPDGSVKWLTVSTVLAPIAARDLALQYGAGVERAAVPDPVPVPDSAFRVRVGGQSVDLALRLEVTRVRGPDAFAGPGRRCLDPKGATAGDTVESGSLEVELRGPVRARVLVRGAFRIPGFGATLPDQVRAVEPAERVPFTFRVTVFRGLPIILVDHQIVYTGEPDRDFIRRWALVLPDRGAGTERLVLEPGVTIDRRDGGETTIPEPAARLCRAPIAGGVALLRNGFEDRPARVGGPRGRDAAVDFWPVEAGPFDLSMISTTAGTSVFSRSGSSCRRRTRSDRVRGRRGSRTSASSPVNCSSRWSGARASAATARGAASATTPTAPTRACGV
ncbi:MAG: hypothetical protein MUE73_00055 [Planctomycetes bacterium]|nr:hypothetical protein [Planctomycetota bacterium]